MSEPTIKEHRLKRGWSQRDLAELAETTLRKLARVEAGVQPCHFRLARRLSKVFEIPVDRLFPGSGKLLDKLGKERHLSNDDIVALGRFGIDGDPQLWTANIRIRGGQRVALPLSGLTFQRMFSALQRHDPQDRFFVFDAEGRRIILNLDHVVLCQFTYEVRGEHEDDDNDDRFSARILLADGSEEIIYGIDPDQPRDGDDMGQLGHLFFMADIWTEESGEPLICHFEDDEGEDVFMRMADVAMFSVPVEAVDTEAMPEYEGDDPGPQGPDNKRPAPEATDDQTPT